MWGSLTTTRLVTSGSAERSRASRQVFNLPLYLRNDDINHVVAELSNVQRDGDAETGSELDEGDGAARELGLQGGNKTTLQEKS